MSRWRGCEAGAGLVSVMVTLALLGVAVTFSVRLYSDGIAVVHRARMRAEAEAVLGWHVADYVDSGGCPAAAPAAVTTLGPDRLSSEQGYSVACASVSLAVWPPDPCRKQATGQTPERCPAGVLSRGWTPGGVDVLTVTVSWDSYGSAREVTRQAVLRT